jgi:hypothetical protein
MNPESIFDMKLYPEDMSLKRKPLVSIQKDSIIANIPLNFDLLIGNEIIRKIESLPVFNLKLAKDTSTGMFKFSYIVDLFTFVTYDQAGSKLLGELLKLPKREFFTHTSYHELPFHPPCYGLASGLSLT